MSRIVSLILFFLLVFPHLLVAAPPLSGQVTWIDDGDTIEIAGVGRVRLIGIDTPEKEDSDRDNYYLRQGVSREQLRRVAAEATHFLIATVKGKTVNLANDQESRDRHGRRLAYVYLGDGRLLNRLLLERGLAAVYRRFDFSLKDEFLAAEADARQAGLGLWQK